VLKKISERGFKNGIWTAPFLAAPDSELFRDHPDWFLKDAKGRPRSGGVNPYWHGRVFALDPTHPEARDHLYKVFKELREGWGADFIKIDFCYAAALPARRHDPQVSRAGALRMGLETIRKAVGDAFVLDADARWGPP